MDRRTTVTVVLLLMLTLPFLGCDSSAEDTGFNDTVNEVNIHSFDSSVNMTAGEAVNLRFTLYNDSSSVKKIVVIRSVTMSDMGFGTISFNDSTILIDVEDTKETVITLRPDKYAKSGTHILSVTISVSDNNGNVSATDTFSFPVTIGSNYAAGDLYNKFMGVYPNTLPEPLDMPIVTALVSLLIWICISSAIGYGAYRVIGFKWGADIMSESRKDAKSIGKMLFCIIMLIGVSMCMKIYGASEYMTGLTTDLISVIFIIVGAIIAWDIYKILLYNIVVKLDKEDRIDDTLIPLFKMIGRIVVCVIALASIMSIFGLNLGTIVTSAGLVSLAISMGAQNTLNQFFCGLQLMATRPFRIGDKIKLGNSSDVLIVRKIRVMETEFKNWLNEEVFRVPNSTVMSAMITNITFNDDTYKIYEYVDVDYGADIDRVKEILLQVVNSHPKVVTDGSKDKPSFRFSSMEASAIRVRVSYVVTDHEISHLVSCQIREAIFRKLRSEGIKIPHNIVDVHLEE